MKRNLVVAAALLFVVGSSLAASVTVRKDGGGDYTTIQAAINSGASTITITDSGVYVENLQIGDPNTGGSTVTLASNQTGTNRPVVTPSADKLYTNTARINQGAGFGLFANNSTVANLILEAQPNLNLSSGQKGSSALMVMANNVLIDNCLFRIATNGLTANAMASANPLLYFGEEGNGSGNLVPGVNPKPGGRDSGGCIVRNCEFYAMSLDADPVEPNDASAGYLFRTSDSPVGTSQASGYVRMDHVTDTGADPVITFEGCYFHHCFDYGIFATDGKTGGGSLNVIVRKCRFDATGKFEVRGRGGNVTVQSSVFSRSTQRRNGDDENSAVAIEIRDGHIPSGSVSNCAFYNCGSANSQRAYYGGVNNPNGNLMTIDHSTFVNCLSGVAAGRFEKAYPVTLAISNSIFHQIGDNVPGAVDAIDPWAITITNGSPELVGGLYPAWNRGLDTPNFASPYVGAIWSAVFNRSAPNTNSQIIINNCMVGSIDTEDTNTWADALSAGWPSGCRLFAGDDTNFVGAGTVTRGTPVFVNTDPDAPNVLQLASGSPGQGLGANLTPVLEPNLLLSLAGNQVTISWTQPIWMRGYALKSTPSLSTPVWTSVPGVSNFAASYTANVTIGGANQFFAVRKE